jgi:FAD synthase
MQFVTKTTGQGSSLVIPGILPVSVAQGMYAVRFTMYNIAHPALMYYGPDPFTGESVFLDVYPLDGIPADFAENVEVLVSVVQYIHPVQTFVIQEQIDMQFQADIIKAREILYSTHEK